MTMVKTLGALILLIVGMSVFQMKHKVDEKDRAISRLYAQYVADKKAVRVLQAEWAYLNDPDYVQDMTLKYLTLRPAKVEQVGLNLSSLPMRSKEQAPLVHVADFIVPGPRLKPTWAVSADAGPHPDIYGHLTDLNTGITATTIDEIVEKVMARRGVEEEKE